MKLLYFLIIIAFIYTQDRHRCPEEIERDERPVLETFYQSPSGHFLIHYDTSGDNVPNLLDENLNTIPDYIEEVALAADSARYVLTEEMGYIQENDDSDGQYDIYILELSSSLWGVTQYESEGGSFIKIRNNYDGMSDFCNNLNDLLWLTVGHEFFHAIQYSYRSSSNDSYFRELTSMWFENIFVPGCYDFLDFVDMSSSSLFNKPNEAFDHTTSASYGYSLALYAHYLSTLVDSKGLDDQLNSTIMREVWEEYQSGSTVFSSLKNVLEENYQVSFSHTWADFMSRNMFSGEFSSMEDNDIYYHEGLALIDSPDIDYENFFNSFNWNINNETLNNDRVSIYGFEALDGISGTASFSSGDYISWYGEISDESSRDEISGVSTYQISNLFNSDKFFFLFSTENNSESIDITVDIDVYGCIDKTASNYNSSATIDDGSCEYSNQILSIYPNPIDLGSSALYIELVQSETSKVNIEIFNLSGKSIYQRNFSVYGEGTHEISLGLMSNLASGVYFVHIKHLDSTEILKFVNIK